MSLKCQETSKGLNTTSNKSSTTSAPVAEAPRIVADEGQRAESVDNATDHTLAQSKEGARLDENTSQRLCQPHGGRQLSWWCHGRCHGMANVWGRMDAGDTGEGKHKNVNQKKILKREERKGIKTLNGPFSPSRTKFNLNCKTITDRKSVV